MYDEPRRRAALKSKDRIESSMRKITRSERPDQKTPPRRSRAPKIIESSETESSSDTEDEEETTTAVSASDTDTAEEQETIEHDHLIPSAPVQKDDDSATENSATETSVENRGIENELVNDLIFMEHNYFLPPNLAPPDADHDYGGSSGVPPSSSSSHKCNNNNNKKRDSIDNKNVLNEILTDNDRNKNIQPKLKRHRKDSIKSELKYKFQMRTKEQERDIIWDIYKDNLDVEDLRYMKEAFESLQQVASKDIALYRWSDLSRIFFDFCCLLVYAVKIFLSSFCPVATGLYWTILLQELLRRTILGELKKHISFFKAIVSGTKF